MHSRSLDIPFTADLPPKALSFHLITSHMYSMSTYHFAFSLTKGATNTLIRCHPPPSASFSQLTFLGLNGLKRPRRTSITIDFLFPTNTISPTCPARQLPSPRHSLPDKPFPPLSPPPRVSPPTPPHSKGQNPPSQFLVLCPSLIQIKLTKETARRHDRTIYLASRVT